MIRFTLFGIPVEIQPWFWVILALLGSSFGQVGGTANEALSVALFVIAGAISILVHELGHAVTGQMFKARPFIVLHGFGGFAAFPGARFTRMQSFIVTAAGPLVQLILGAIVLAAWFFLPDLSEAFRSFVMDLAIVSLFWALLNLIPVFPLDGGQMMAAALGPQRRKLCLQLSIAVAVTASAALLLLKIGFMMPIFMLYFAYQNFQELKETHR
jgi:stage IV sporulation protein FB